MSVAHILVDGSWRASQSAATFQAVNPKTMQPLATQFPISTWADLEPMIIAASKAFEQLRTLPDELRATFLENYANLIDHNKTALADLATLETGLPVEPRLVVNEIPRTVDQLRQAAQSVRRNDWQLATHDSQRNIHSCYIPLGPVLVIGPNNFPFAYNSVSGGDFASAIAAGCPVIAKGHPAHPGTTQKLAELAQQAATDAKLPPGSVQMLYHLEPADGLKLVSDRRITSVGFTGSRTTGLALKKVADEHGKPIFLEMGSLNPVVLLPGALEERFDALMDEVTGSCLLGMGQFCTNPGILFFIDGPKSQAFIEAMKVKYQAAPVGTLLTQGVRDNLHTSVQALRESGALLLTGGQPGGGAGFSYQHTLMQTTGSHFLKTAEALQREAFGNATLAVVCKSIEELKQVLQQLEGQLVGSIYSDTKGKDNQQYDQLAPVIRNKIGRLLNDRMPTGVMVSPAMNHGGPYPATGHPHFTAVGFPASIRRFCMLACYDNVRTDRLPAVLRKGLSS